MLNTYNNDPLVSVIIPFYNGSSTIRKTVDSVRRQTYKHYEIIIVDDGSSENVGDTLKGYTNQVNIIRQENQGTLAARNTGMANMRGDFIAFLDQDDWWQQDKLEDQIRFLKKNSHIGLVFSNLEAVNRRGERLGFTVVPKNLRHDPTWEDLICIYPLYPSSSIIRADLFNHVQYDTQFGLSGAYGDQDFHARLREITEFHYMDRCMGRYYWVTDRKSADVFLANFNRYAIKHWSQPRLQGQITLQTRQRFAHAIRNETIVLFRRLLTENGNNANINLLNRFIDYEKSLIKQLGPGYVDITGIKMLDPSLFESDEFTCTILYLFLSRLDYQQAFPEVYGGDLNRYLKWIGETRDGRSSDPDRSILDTAVNRVSKGVNYEKVVDIKLNTSPLARTPYYKRIIRTSSDYISSKGILEFLKAAIKKIARLEFRV